MIDIHKLRKYALNQLPNVEGVYFVFDSKDILIYIGKSKDINNRLKTHVSKCKSNKSPLKSIDISHVSFVLKNIDYTCTSEKAERYYQIKYNGSNILKYDNPFGWLQPLDDIGEITNQMQREALRNIPMR